MKPAWALLMWIGLAVGQYENTHLPTHAKQHDFQNPLERVNVLGTTVDIDNEIKLQVNTTTVTGARGDWVEVCEDSQQNHSLHVICHACLSLRCLPTSNVTVLLVNATLGV